MKALKTWFVAAAALLAAGTVASAQAPAPAASLAAARTLYASAEYGGALDMLNGLVGETPAGPERQAIELYRALCLVAVGNTTEAGRVIEAMIQQDPLYRPSADDVPPKLRSAITDARRRLLPSIVQQNYVSAKAAFDKKDYPAAAKGFAQVLAGLNDPDIETVSAQPPLSDLKMLASGFNDLAAKAVAPAAPAAPSAPAAETMVARVPRIYSTSDRDVVPPVTVRQAVPPYPGRVLLGGSLIVDVVIDGTGTVESAVMASPPNPAYDRLVLGAAKNWQYQPAVLNGSPVKYRKRIQITLVPTPAGR
ncbi:MAG TPA: TonB family protein [Thermoanaerobaculia bacterium]|nr:TonB family protein [Thermoanaerobaculia bacterium]